MEKLTAKYLEDEFGANVYAASKYAFSLGLPYPERPHKPSLKTNHSIGEAKAYISDLEVYEIKEIEYKKLHKAYSNNHSEIGAIVRDYIYEISGLNSIPEQYRDKAWSFAWDLGHSDGYSAVYNYLVEIIDIFK